MITLNGGLANTIITNGGVRPSRQIRARSVDLFAPIWIGPTVAVGDQWFALTDHKRLDC